jgi:hypothetical protein
VRWQWAKTADPRRTTCVGESLVRQAGRAYHPEMLRLLARYILYGHTPVRCDDILAYDLWRETADRTVGSDDIFPEGPGGAKIRVTTIFLTLDYQWQPDGPPLLFETTVHDQTSYQWLYAYARKYSTWEEAELGHREVCAEVRRERKGSSRQT